MKQTTSTNATNNAPACTIRILKKVYSVQNDEVLAKAIYLIDNERVKDGQNQIVFAHGVNSETIEEFAQNVKEYLKPRKTRELSEETKQRNYEKQLAKLKAKYGM